MTCSYFDCALTLLSRFNCTEVFQLTEVIQCIRSPEQFFFFCFAYFFIKCLLLYISLHSDLTPIQRGDFGFNNVHYIVLMYTVARCFLLL